MTPVAPGKGARLSLMVGSLSAAVVVVLDASGKPALVVENLWLLRADHHLLGHSRDDRVSKPVVARLIAAAAHKPHPHRCDRAGM